MKILFVQMNNNVAYDVEEDLAGIDRVQQLAHVVLLKNQSKRNTFITIFNKKNL